MIEKLVSLREAGRRLGVNPSYIKGVAVTLGINLFHAAQVLGMTEADFVRVATHIAELPKKRHRGNPRPVSAAV